jgi:hypothetical protein
MDWLDNLIKVTKDYFNTNGLITLVVIILTASITTILGYAIPAFGRFMKFLPRHLEKAGKMFKDWWYWRRFKPQGSIKPIDKLIIEPSYETKTGRVLFYKISLNVELEFKNMDELNRLNIDTQRGGRFMSLQITSKHMKKRTKTYIITLQSENLPWHIVSGMERQSYTFIGIYYTVPILSNIVSCKVKNLPYIEIGDVGNYFKLKTFAVDVNWGQIKNREANNG